VSGAGLWVYVWGVEVDVGGVEGVGGGRERVCGVLDLLGTSIDCMVLWSSEALKVMPVYLQCSL
jgi:hypothetical protein